MQIFTLTFLGWIWAIMSLFVIAWLIDRVPILDRILTHPNPWISNPAFILVLATWPLVVALALPGLWTRARRWNREAI